MANTLLQINPVTSKINFKALDCLRGLAAAYVVLSHARGQLFAGGSYLAIIKPIKDWSVAERIYVSLLQATSLGHQFVIFFFILSGFSIAFSISKSKGIIGFYKRRLIRIYPPYLLGLVWAVVVFLLIKLLVPLWLGCSPDNHMAKILCSSTDFLSARHIIENVFYIPSGAFLAPYWSLPLEIIFYLLIPVFVRSIKWYLLISFLVYIVSIVFVGPTFNSPYILTSYLLHYNFYFAIGVWLFYFRGFLENKLSYLTNRYIFLAAISIIFLLMMIGNYYLNEDHFAVELLACAFSLICIKYFLNNNYEPKLLAFLGKFSYTIYIGHFASIYLFAVLLHTFFGYDGSEITNRYIWLLGFVFALACCYALYFVAEKPGKNWLKKLRN